MSTITRLIRMPVIAAAAAIAVGFCSFPGAQLFGVCAQAQEKEDRDGTAKTEDKRSSFDQAVEAFYSGSEDMTDEQILQAARELSSDVSELYSVLWKNEAADVEAVLTAYEASKAGYMTDLINSEDSRQENQQQKDTSGQPEGAAGEAGGQTGGAAGHQTAGAADGSAGQGTGGAAAIVREWALQSEYARLMIAEGSCIREMIPRFQVTSCSLEDGILKLGINEWMTQAYGARDGSGPANASAYSYTFSLSLSKGDDGGWKPCAINGTEANFQWLQDGQDSPSESDTPESTPEAGKKDTQGQACPPPTLYAVQSDADAQILAYARLATEPDTDPEASSAEALFFSDLIPADLFSEEAARPDGLPETAGPALAKGEGDSALIGTASKSYSYSPSKAASYADKYWRKYNTKYVQYPGVDCANFVSQCLYAGGMQKTGDWYPRSVNWINVMGQISHFKAYGSYVTAQNANVRKGNPVYYDWNGNNTYDHVGICVGTNASGMPVVDAHTNNVYHVPWRMGNGGKRKTILLRSSGAGTGSASSKKQSDTSKKQSNTSKKQSSSGSSATAVTGSSGGYTWKTIGTKVYCLKKNGERVRNSFLTIDGMRYYFDSTGARAGGFFKTGGKWYYASVRDGHLLRGWQRINKKIYYFFTTSYARVTAGKRKIGNGVYCFNSNGQVRTGFLKVGGNWYYANPITGRFVTGWHKINEKWYYFDRTTMVRASGWRTIDGKKCYFDAGGVLKQGSPG